MFQIGDKVVYPMHGAGVIESIEEREILGEKRSYYVMKIPIGDMKVMVPMDSVKNIGLRQVIDEDGVNRVMTILQERKSSMSANWNRRYRANMEKLKTGNVYEIAEVVRNLMIRNLEKGLSSGERKMLEYARQMLVSELVLSKGQEEHMVESLIEGAFA